MYEVDGVWEETTPPSEKPPAEPTEEPQQPEVAEERTQVVRIMFRLPGRYDHEAREAGCFDVLRAIVFWTMAIQGSLDEHQSWSKHEYARLLAHHAPWPRRKAAFARRVLCSRGQRRRKMDR